MVIFLTFFMAIRTRKKIIVQKTLFLWLCITILIKIEFNNNMIISEDDIDFDTVSGLTLTGWQILRLASYGLDYCDAFENPSSSQKIKENKRIFSLANLLGYTFYLPVLSQGPLILFSLYSNMIKENASDAENNDAPNRIIRLLRDLGNVAGICFVSIFMMHYLYTDPVTFDEDVRICGETLGIFFCRLIKRV